MDSEAELVIPAGDGCMDEGGGSGTDTLKIWKVKWTGLGNGRDLGITGLKQVKDDNRVFGLMFTSGHHPLK